MKIFAVYSSKGGVGKTATAVNLSYCAARQGHRVLLCDIDAQGAASYYFRVKAAKSFSGKKLLGGGFDKYIRASDYENLDLLPAHFSFRNLDLALAKLEASTRRRALKNLFDSLSDHYDVLVMDCPPNITLLSENIILAADSVVTPVIPTTLSLVALKQLLKIFRKVGAEEKRINAFFSMVEPRKLMHKDVVEKFQHYPIFRDTQIPFQAEIEKMGIYRQPVGAVSPTSVAAQRYQELWQELWDRSELI
ncbi:ParA family protein [Desulfosediminicola sp.]|uniref:ParA family protein n=1 Tax=Desulfosediminicola sp. TaxID=2886825 RepID=UPI003AF29AD1